MQMMFLLLHVQLPFCIPKVAGTYTPSLQLPLVLFLMYLPHHTLKMLVEFAPILMIIHFLASVSETPPFHYSACLFSWRAHC